jgi:hypothetical protein
LARFDQREGKLFFSRAIEVRSSGGGQVFSFFPFPSRPPARKETAEKGLQRRRCRRKNPRPPALRSLRAQQRHGPQGQQQRLLLLLLPEMQLAGRLRRQLRRSADGRRRNPSQTPPPPRPRRRGRATPAKTTLTPPRRAGQRSPRPLGPPPRLPRPSMRPL